MGTGKCCNICAYEMQFSTNWLAENKFDGWKCNSLDDYMMIFDWLFWNGVLLGSEMVCY